MSKLYQKFYTRKAKRWQYLIDLNTLIGLTNFYI